ncbi:MAG: PEP-CTERM sorting domain-containing protein [Candidatus Omnitrophota bacterium]|nr:PEP-CTERM sorting domain-containing protein [Candidatus Omnitrophota bacterium]
MKKLIIVLVIVLFPSMAHAFFPVISEPITRRAVAQQGTWTECNDTYLTCPSFPYSGFTSNQSDDGLGNEFNFTKTYILTAVSGYYIPDQFYVGSSYTPDFDIRLYKGTRYSYLTDSNVPDKLYKNWNVQAPPYDGANRDFNENDLYIVDGLNVRLTPGKYWIAAQAGGDGSMFPGSVYGHVVPEPSTMLLLGGGLAGAFWRRRKFSKV